MEATKKISSAMPKLSGLANPARSVQRPYKLPSNALLITIRITLGKQKPALSGLYVALNIATFHFYVARQVCPKKLFYATTASGLAPRK